MKNPKPSEPTAEDNERLIAEYAKPYIDMVLAHGADYSIRYKGVIRTNTGGEPRVILQLDITIPVK